ncbi:hypothetical protein Agub_g459 [Astrephomene gubernaculifera]|uniref:Uncharacterized protein n=1 Tax=Astrephomene gubernaculifera TaxID=47775 RepID=A0AAD3HGZ3_9CHLO|nr:hypothetical protein Agub_g459 [Astrephomene gubernaculifera]
MATMAKATTIALLVAACFCVALARDNAVRTNARRLALAGMKTPVGWWYTLKTKSGMFCGLRDFPPKPDGYGSSRLYCIFPTYDHYWMWRVTKVNDTGALTSGDEVYLTVYQPMLPYCKVSSGIVVCGVGASAATKFVIEKETGKGAINLTTDAVYLKSATKYCSLTGKNHSQVLQCDKTAKSSGTAFLLPASAYTAAALVNGYTEYPCGGDFYPDNDPSNITCGIFNAPGFVVNMTVALGTPGAPVIKTGTNVTFKAYDDLYRYHMSQFKVNKQTKRMYFEVDNPAGANQWFQMVLLTNSSTTASVPLTNGTMVALKSAVTGQYCGLTVAAGSLSCNMTGHAAALPAGYTYRFMDGGWPMKEGTTATWDKVASGKA